jgi:hypothetical protein
VYDVFFLSYDESYATAHWNNLKGKHLLARHVSGICGIHAAHRHCADISRTSHFFVVDSDNEVTDPSVFRIKLPVWDRDYVHLWNARNPVNGLVYGWGGIKLFPKAVFDDMTDRLDMTTSFPLKLMDHTASITHFNATPEATWRSAFRECVKLSQSQESDAQVRMEVWCTTAKGVFAEHCLRGAQEGRDYGLANMGDQDALMRINDYRWLTERFVDSRFI